MAAEGTLDVLAEQQWLQPVEDAVGTAVSQAYSAGGETGRKIKNFLHGTWLGHPLHPVLTDIPVGAWTAAVIMDTASGGNDESLARGAETAVCVGLIGALGAAVTGITDWKETDGKARRMGLIHGLLNLTGFALFTASYFLRRSGRHGEARGYGYAGYGVALAAAYLGGNLVFTQRIGTDHSAGNEPRGDDFTPVLRDSELADGELRRVEKDGRRILLARRQGRVFAMVEVCSHLGGPLADGKLEGDCVKCPWHGSRFYLQDGSVADGPATHPQPTLQVRIHNGFIEVK